MSCPIDHETLVRYWAHDLSDDEVDALDEHLFSCAACSAASARVAALARGLAEAIPTVALGRDVERLRAAGVATLVNEVHPGETKVARFPPDPTVIVQRLVCDLLGARRVSIDLQTLDGRSLLRFDDAPFDPTQGAVLVTCQRHLLEFGEFRDNPDLNIVVQREDATGQRHVDTYGIQHRFD